MDRYEKFLKEHQGEIQEICDELLDEFGEDYEGVERIYFFYNTAWNEIQISARGHEEMTVAIYHSSRKKFEMLKNWGKNGTTRNGATSMVRFKE